MNMLRTHICITGQVQGVGFRPHVYRLAQKHSITGFISNTSKGVDIEAQGTTDAIQRFSAELTGKAPPLSRITSITQENIPILTEEHGFIIQESHAEAGSTVLISPDYASCPQCLADINNPQNRRHNYPFTNCTNCGPRYTITHSIPYDRKHTSMACFPMCPECLAEYTNPLDRRFHAQPNACPTCGPNIWFYEPHGQNNAQNNAQKQANLGKSHLEYAQNTSKLVGHAALLAACTALAEGKILAVKGLGGFHICCDANGAGDATSSITLLRHYKKRPHKPFAVMGQSLESLQKIAHINPAEAEQLTDIARPIVLCKARTDTPESRALSADIHRGTPNIGIFLPYTPLHALLLKHFQHLQQTDVYLIMTSGNAPGLPICLGNREALNQLSPIVDAFLLHNRDILIRVDDSVLARPTADSTLFFRRARGFTPTAVFFPEAEPAPPHILAFGAELKGSACLTRNNQAFVSQYLGNMHSVENQAFHKQCCAHLTKIYTIEPQIVVHDAHPDYASTRLAQEYAHTHTCQSYALQHHAGHIWAVLAEHAWQKPVLGVAFDGTGHGTTGHNTPLANSSSTVWGGEFLYIDPGKTSQGFMRLASLRPFPLAGGDNASKEPWRMAQSTLWSIGIDTPAHPKSPPWHWLARSESNKLQTPDVTQTNNHIQAAQFVTSMLQSNTSCPLTSSAGRLFDAVASLLNICHISTYEGQAAILLEAQQDLTCQEFYALPILHHPNNNPSLGEPLWEVDTHNLIQQICTDINSSVPYPVISRKFHLGLAHSMWNVYARAQQQFPVTAIALSGGCFQNSSLLQESVTCLAPAAIPVLTQQQFAPNDECLSLGQAYYAFMRQTET